MGADTFDQVARFGVAGLLLVGAGLYIGVVVVLFVRAFLVGARRLPDTRRARLDAAARTDHAVSALPDVSGGNPRLRR